jgi:CHC2 zinc finger/Toprim domain
MAIDAEALRAARDTPIGAIASEHGLKLRRLGAERVGACPCCGGTDRFSLNIRKQIFNCRGCGGKGDVIALVQHIEGVSFVEAVERLIGVPWRPSSPRRYPPSAQDGRRAVSEVDGDDAERTAAALALWNSAVDLRGTAAETYLRSRKLELNADFGGDVLRWHARAGAMLALFRDIKSDEPRAVSRTFLDKNARKIERKFLGPVSGAAVKLDTDEEVLVGLHIGEGIETGLAARQLGLRPTWALGSAGAIAAFPVLAAIDCLTLLAEHDNASARAVEACAERWDAAGREVFINRAIGGKDLNDALKGVV